MYIIKYVKCFPDMHIERVLNYIVPELEDGPGKIPTVISNPVTGL